MVSITFDVLAWQTFVLWSTVFPANGTGPVTIAANQSVLYDTSSTVYVPGGIRILSGGSLVFKDQPASLITDNIIVEVRYEYDLSSCDVVFHCL